MQVRILHRYHKANDWAAFTGSDAILKKGEIGVESDTGLCKIGDGKTTWNELAYSDGEGLQSISQSYGYINKDSDNRNHRGYLVQVYTGTSGKYTDRLFMFLNKTEDGITKCELTPVSVFADIRDQAEIEQ